MHALLACWLMVSSPWEVAPLPERSDPTSLITHLHDAGMERFSDGDYDEALIEWKQAFVLLSHERSDQAIRETLAVNIVVAHARAYEVGHNPEHLVEAMRVIDLRKAELAHFSGQQVTDELAALDERRAELVQLHEVALRQGEMASELAAGTAFRVVAPPPSDPGPPHYLADEVDESVASSPRPLEVALGKEFRSAKSMAECGLLVLLVGIPTSMGVLVATGALNSPKDGFYEPWRLAPGLAVLGIHMVVGGTVHGIGKKRKQQIMAEYEARPHRPTAVPMPLALPHGGGLGFVGRF